MHFTLQRFGHKLSVPFSIGNNHIFVPSKIPSDDPDKACIDVNWIDPDTLLIDSYYDEPSADCSLAKQLRHVDTFNAITLIASALSIKRIILVDGARIIMGKCEWNLRIVNRLKQFIEKKPMITFYEKFGFKPLHDPLHSILKTGKLPKLQTLLKYVSDKELVNEYVESNGIETLEDLITLMYTHCSDPELYELVNELYPTVQEELISAITKMAGLEVNRLTQTYYLDVPSNAVRLHIHRASGVVGQIQLNTRGGKRTRRV